MYSALLAGATVVLADPEAPVETLLGQLRDFGATVCEALPRQYADYARAADRAGTRPRLDALRLPLFGGAYSGRGLLRHCAAALGLRPRRIYGSAEFGVALTEHEHGSGMYPVDGVGARLAPLGGDDGQLGELVLLSGCTSEGYVGNEESNARAFRDGEFWTGDVASRSADGGYEVLGRISEILESPEGPLPGPVFEAELAEAPGIGSAVCVPDGPGAVRVLAERVPGYLNAELQSAVAARAGGHGIRARIRVVSAIPRTPVGKPNRAAVAALLAEPGAGEREV